MINSKSHRLLAFIGLLSLLATVPRTTYAQLELDLITDKTHYASGEPIEITFTAQNVTADTLRVTFGNPCVAHYVFDEVDMEEHGGCVHAIWTFVLSPQQIYRSRWIHDPTYLGIPDTSGTHQIYAKFRDFGQTDPITISADAYLGGRVSVGFAEGITEDDVADVRDSLNAIVEFNGSSGWQRWRISGVSPQIAEKWFEDDPRFRWFEHSINEPFGYGEIITATKPLPVISNLKVGAPYPNPTRTVAHIPITLEHRQQIRLDLFDVTGRHVRVLHDGQLSANTTHTFSFKVGDLPNGMYLYRVQGETLVKTGTVIVTK